MTKGSTTLVVLGLISDNFLKKDQNGNLYQTIFETLNRPKLISREI